MDSLMHWAAMGGYAVWVWASYGIVTIVLAGLFVTSNANLRRREAEIARADTRRRPSERRDAQ
jgi:heme exporter protein D